MKSIVVIGGGAAGFFGALAAKKANPLSKVILLEKTATLLAKVRISGGGRCNVTHSCFDPKELVKNYPRGNKALLGPFTRFQPQDTIEWFEKRGVKLKTEKDGRMFPITDSSETIINCLTDEAKKLNIDIRLKQRIKGIRKEERFVITFDDHEMECDKVILATGSSHQGFDFARALGHTIVEPVPSLFSFNLNPFPLLDVAGVSVLKATLKIKESSFEQTGPLLVTHWGFSGPAALKLSAWAARYLHEKAYKTELTVDWLPDFSLDEVKALKKNPPEISKSLWKHISSSPKNYICNMDGKTTYKDEFVTAGGVNLDEVNFRTMESRICPGLHFAGEVLDIDGVTGGFNFQNAWTTSYLAGTSLS